MRIRTIEQETKDSVGAQVNLTAKAFSAALAARLPQGWTTTQVAVLAHLAQHPGSSQRDIAASTRVDAATLTELLKRLEKRGLVRRAPDPTDARRMIVSIGEIDPRVLSAALQAAREVNATATRGFTDAERAGLIPLLARMRANLDHA